MCLIIFWTCISNLYNNYFRSSSNIIIGILQVLNPCDLSFYKNRHMYHRAIFWSKYRYPVMLLGWATPTMRLRCFCPALLLNVKFALSHPEQRNVKANSCMQSRGTSSIWKNRFSHSCCALTNMPQLQCIYAVKACGTHRVLPMPISTAPAAPAATCIILRRRCRDGLQSCHVLYFMYFYIMLC